MPSPNYPHPDCSERQKQSANTAKDEASLSLLVKHVALDTIRCKVLRLPRDFPSRTRWERKLHLDRSTVVASSQYWNELQVNLGYRRIFGFLSALGILV
ncbi:hypothetical protein Egran_02149 [Elaphomyces granulatus]|uniref:Uncharacterized protein n=1 Tax=Elaphomyces granulatus TaxID=519963 RepID=A0A232M112_9EURO|nr:hypothetical protein Egran_02149 [Elaphomyces granulatus]